MTSKGPFEAALSSDLRGEPYNFSLWDIYTGTQLVVFKGNKSNPTPKCLQLIDNNYFITAHDKVLHVWSIFNKKCQDQKLFLPGRPSTLCMSPCSNYLIAGISDMINIWQVCSGNLLARPQRHYQTISALKMSQDGSYLFSAGDDGLTLVWPFPRLISNIYVIEESSKHDVVEPKFVWQHHSGPVTDLHVTNGGLCITASIDKTCNLYSYTRGTRLYCFSFPSQIWSVMMDRNEARIFFGDLDGNIYKVNVPNISITRPKSVVDEQTSKPLLVGHKKKIVNMIVSTDGTRLVSASHDSTCKIWDLRNDKLLQELKHQAPLANLTSLLVPEGLALTSMTQSRSAPPLTLRPLKHNLYKPPRDATIYGDDLFDETITTIVHIKNKTNLWSVPIDASISIDKNNAVLENGTSKETKSAQLEQAFNNLYHFAAKEIFDSAAEEMLRRQFEPVLNKSSLEKLTQVKKSTKKVSISPKVEIRTIKRRRN